MLARFQIRGLRVKIKKYIKEENCNWKSVRCNKLKQIHVIEMNTVNDVHDIRN